MKRSNGLPVCWFLLTFLVGTGCGPHTEPSATETTTNETTANETRKPDIFLLSIDTLRADHLGIYGYERETSPFLDQLATEGTYVEQAVVATHGTTPSHASILTSVPQQVHGVGLEGRADDVVPGSLRNLPEVFRAAGYATLAVTGGGNVGRSFGFDRGFDVFDDAARGVEDGRARLLEYLAAVPEDRPVFVFFHTYEVHTPYAPPPELLGRFGATASELPTTSERLVALANHADTLTPEDLEHLRARYDEGILHTDRALRLLFDTLRERGRFDDALIAITSDHGEEFGEHGGLVHRDLLYEELLRVPMIFWGPRLPDGTVAPRTALSLDIAPTLVACAGLPVPESWMGNDILCSQDRKTTHAGTLPELHVSQYGERRYGVRTPEWKLIVSTTPDGSTTELYDLASDPAERENLSRAHPEVVARLMTELRRWRADLTTVASDMAPAELGEQERERLRALGYLD